MIRREKVGRSVGRSFLTNVKSIGKKKSRKVWAGAAIASSLASFSFLTGKNCTLDRVLELWQCTSITSVVLIYWRRLTNFFNLKFFLGRILGIKIKIKILLLLILITNKSLYLCARIELNWIELGWIGFFCAGMERVCSVIAVLANCRLRKWPETAPSYLLWLFLFCFLSFFILPSTAESERASFVELWSAR